jgi:lysophospholipid acyltransferase (LPLAT)-like uncharacterized protein
MIAMMTNATVYPVRAIPDASWHLNSWDRFMIPKPFTKVTAHIGEPLIPETFGKNVDRFSQAIQQALSA